MNGPLRLAIGSHKPGTDAGCAMNVESWINGDEHITDLPDGADRLLASTVQYINDNMCTDVERDVINGEVVFYLCPDCSVGVLALAARTRGTNLYDWSSAVLTWLKGELAAAGREVTVTEREELLVWGHRVFDRFDEIIDGLTNSTGTVSRAAL